MIKPLSIIFLLLPVILSHPTIERLLAADFNYKLAGIDWTGTCSTGALQSPIDIDTSSGPCDNTMVFDLSFDAGSRNITIFDTDETFRGLTTASTLYATDVDGLLLGYQSTQFHLHAPSEHRIEGDGFDAELHIVHNLTSQFAAKQATKFTYAVVSILFKVDDSAENHPFINALNLATTVLNKNSSAAIDWKNMLFAKLPTNITYYTYRGSFGIPPCDEIVNWYVMEEPQKVKSTQLTPMINRWISNATFSAGTGNARQIQATNDRVVKKGGDECEEQFVYFFSFVILFIFINYFIFKIL